MTLKDQRFYFFKEKSVYRFLKKKIRKLIPLANLAVMGNNLDCSTKNHKFKFTLWNLLWEIPLPSCSSSPKKQIPTSFIRFHIDAFFLISLPIHALKDLKPLCEFTVAPWSQDCGDRELPAQHSVSLIPPSPVHLLSCALNLLLLWGKHPSCREGMGRAERGSGSGWRSAGGAGKVDKGNFGLWLRAVVPRCPLLCVRVSISTVCPVPLPSLLVGHCHLQTHRWELPESLWLSKALGGGAFPRPNHIPVSGASPQALPSQRDSRAAVGHLWKMNQSLSKLCVYIPKCLARIWRILGYPTIRKVPAGGTFVPLIGD